MEIVQLGVDESGGMFNEVIGKLISVNRYGEITRDTSNMKIDWYTFVSGDLKGIILKILWNAEVVLGVRCLRARSKKKPLFKQSWK